MHRRQPLIQSLYLKDHFHQIEVKIMLLEADTWVEKVNL